MAEILAPNTSLLGCGASGTVFATRSVDYTVGQG